MDRISPDQRSFVMSTIRGANTKPEMVVRRCVHALGLRFRLHGAKLPGRPDIVFPRYKLVIFVHGCFWHQHSCPKGGVPKSNVAFWTKKLAENVKRDQQKRAALEALGWRVVEIWECQTHNVAELTSLLIPHFQTRANAR
ncbi:MAG: DNA mismatch endonuclease Vsr [Rhodocyclales bacterium]|nr:DNA mismatch endonuclease Vsr [Rhodocyclales bacterium]